MSAKIQEDLVEADRRVRLAEARKLEVEAAEIEVRIEERRLRMVLVTFAVLTPTALLVLTLIQAALAPGHPPIGGEELGRWLPMLLARP